MTSISASKPFMRKAAAPVIPIRNAHAFDEAVMELDFLADSNPKEGTPQYDRMELLAILIAAYEEDNLPRRKAASPQELVQFMAEQKGMSSASLAELLGGRSRLSEFLGGARELSKNQIIALMGALGIPADLLLGGDKGL